MGEGGERHIDLPIEERLQNLAQELGFIETEELKEVKDRFLDSRDEKKDKAIVDEYHRLAIKQVNQQPDKSLPRAQIGLNIALAAMYRTRGYSADYQISMKNALHYASRAGDYETVNQLLAVLLKDEKYPGSYRKIPPRNPIRRQLGILRKPTSTSEVD